MTNNQQLRELYKAGDLTYDEIASITGFSYCSVRAWLSKPEASQYRAMSNIALDDLKLYLNWAKG